MRGCLSFVKKDDRTNFEMILKIETNGKISGVYERPANALTTCFKGLISNVQAPHHQFDSFLFYVDMRIAK